MLQRIHDSLGRWVAALVLGLVSAGFIFWGVQRGSLGTASFAAKVNGEDITISEFDRALQNRQSEYQRLYRSELTEDLRRQLRRSVIDDMVRATALKQRVDAQGYRASNERVTQSIRDISAFQVDGKFSLDVYRGLLANQGLTPTGFEALQREDLEAQDLQNGIVDSTFLTPAEFRRYIELYNQRRELAYARLRRRHVRAEGHGGRCGDRRALRGQQGELSDHRDRRSRVRRARARRHRGGRRGDGGRSARRLRRAEGALPDARGASRPAHPDRCRRRQRGRRARDGRQHRAAPEERRGLREAREGILDRRRHQGPGRRSRLDQPRHADGPVRGCAVRDEGGRGQRARAQRLRLAHHPPGRAARRRA